MLVGLLAVAAALEPVDVRDSGLADGEYTHYTHVNDAPAYLLEDGARESARLPYELAWRLAAHVHAEQRLAVHLVVQLHLHQTPVASQSRELTDERRLARARRPVK